MVGPSSPDRRPGRVKLLVLYGGRSAEHDVSCVSARHVVGAVDPERYDLRLIGITTDGRWLDTTAASLAAAAGQPSPDALPSPDAVAATSPEVVPMSMINSPLGPDRVDEPLVVLPLVHGPMGEDGTVQGLLELAGLPYCGPGVAGSAAAMDKVMTKALLHSAGLPQARYLHRHESELGCDMAAEVEAHLGWPVFVKPANMGSSIGISKVKDPGGLDLALERACRYDDHVVIEESVTGREIEIGVLGWPDLRTSVPGEIRPSRDFYDFDDKYLAGTAGLEIPARLPGEVVGELSRLAVAACRALRVDSMARVDFFWEQGGRGLLVNEVNTIPGFTPISMYPRMWAASGVSYQDLVDTLVDQAVRRAERRSRFQTGH